MDLGAAHTGKGEQRVDQLAHALCSSAHAREVALSLRVEVRAIVLQDGLTEAVDAPERRAQIVCDGVAEGFEVAVRGVGLDVRTTEHLLLLLHPVDVRAGAEPSRDETRGVPDRQRPPQEPVISPQLVLEPVLDLVGVAGRGRRVPLREALRLILGVDDVGPARVAADSFGAPRDLVPASVVVVEAAIRSSRPDDLRHRIGELSEPPLAVAKRLLGLPTLADVGVDARPFTDRPIRIEHRHRADGEVSVLPIPMTQSVLERERGPVGDCTRADLDGGGSVFGMNGFEPAATPILSERLPGVRRPAQLLADHLSREIVSPDHLRDRKNERPVSLEMSAKAFLVVSRAVDGLLFELDDSCASSDERLDVAENLRCGHGPPRRLHRIMVVTPSTIGPRRLWPNGARNAVGGRRGRLTNLSLGGRGADMRARGARLRGTDPPARSHSNTRGERCSRWGDHSCSSYQTVRQRARIEAGAQLLRLHEVNDLRPVLPEEVLGDHL